ncbi:MAG: SDR family NAD(P)-dependent oxidoreductase [Proteobacteria bacterium]|nr:SDR family NAD(P)-dependent oxidoreductase [Pseudomonadota bacterium]MDA1301583.1 SDR family NAD(P)-dependent oxidoreductase [Pseudomonadota bacterium]
MADTLNEQLKGKVAIITGGAGGIGSRIARAYARAGAMVVIAGRRQDKLDEVANPIRSEGHEILAISTDVTIPEQVDRLIEQTVAQFGTVDIMVNNAGGAMFIKPPEELRPEEWSAALALNLTSVFLCSAAAGKVMMAGTGGRIINISSVAGMRLSPNFVHYGAAKAGVINLTKSLAVCWGPHNINVNCIAPGLTATEGVANWLPPRTGKDGSPVPPLQFPPDPEHVADLAVFLASDGSARISGELFPIRALGELA